MSLKKKFLIIIAISLNLFFLNSMADEEKIVNVYNWANFMPTSILKSFEKETGIHVNYSEFDGNSTLYAKLKVSPRIGFDVIVPSSYYVERMRREGMLEKLDYRQLSNFHNMNPTLLNQSFDPSNQYSIPYFWGTTGIVVNDLYYNPKKFTHWSDLWDPQYKNQLLILDDDKEAFSMALITLHYSPNTTNPREIRAAYKKLQALMPNIKIFNADALVNVFVDEDAVLGMGWSGDIYTATLENSHLHYIYPKPKFSIWMDCLAVPQDAPHFKNAMLFINYLMRPDIAKIIAENVGYSTPNMTAMKLLPKKMRDNPIFNPPKNILQNGIIQSDTGKANNLYEHYWQLLKLGSR